MSLSLHQWYRIGFVSVLILWLSAFFLNAFQDYLLYIDGIGGGASAKVNGQKFVDGVKLSLLSDVTRFTYRKIVGYKATTQRGGAAVQKRPDQLPIKGANNIGVQGEKLTGKLREDFFKEGGSLSKQANKIPSINAVAGLHDVFQVELGTIGNWARNLFNVPGMVPAAGITAGSLMTDPAFADAVSSYSKKSEPR